MNGSTSSPAKLKHPLQTIANLLGLSVVIKTSWNDSTLPDSEREEETTVEITPKVRIDQWNPLLSKNEGAPYYRLDSVAEAEAFITGYSLAVGKLIQDQHTPEKKS